MKKTGYEIIGMIKDGKAPKKIKKNNYIFEYDYDVNNYKCNSAIVDFMQFLNDEFEIIEDSKVWKPSKKDVYFTINTDIIERYIFEEDKTDCSLYSIGNCFKTEEEAKKQLEKLKIYTQLKRYAEEHNTEKIDWNNFDQEKWTIIYDMVYKKIMCLPYYCSINICQIYFTSKELCYQAIQEIGEDNIKKLFD